jgi:MGT family glycosyltransferase
MASQYMKNSKKELADMILGLPRLTKVLKTLEPYGYHVKNALSLVQSDNNTDSVVYTSRKFQPYVESFSDHYTFVGPSVFSETIANKEKDKPLVYISMGTVINDRPDFYEKCIKALGGMNADVIISCGNTVDIKALGELPDNFKIYPRVDQLDVLSRSDAFITHCGMNSVSESLYMATPLVLYPQTGEQRAVARRVKEIGAGVELKDDSVEGIKRAVSELLNNKPYKDAAVKCCEEFRSCLGSAGAAEFIENAPHKSNGKDLLADVNKASGKFRIVYWMIIALIIVLFGIFIGWGYVWIIGVAGGTLSYPIGKIAQNKIYKSMVKKL